MSRRVRLAVLSLLAVAVIGILGWGFVAYRLFIDEDGDPLHHVDAVVVLAGDPPDRFPVGLNIVDRGLADTLVLSAPPRAGGAAGDRCAEPAPGVVCFAPDPESTTGEARAIGRLAAEHGWESLAVVSSSYHLTRARHLIESCTEAELTMVAAPTSREGFDLLGAAIHETGGLLVALIDPAC